MTTRQANGGALEFARLLWRAGDVREVRVPRHNRFGHTASGYFDDPASLASAVASWDGRANVYVTLNPVAPALLSRAADRILPRADHTTSDAEIVQRRWLMFDIDPVRPAGISSTDAELAAAHEVADRAMAFLGVVGWPEPLVVMSGNGYQVLYRVDLPNEPASLTLVQEVLEEVAASCDSAAAHIDRAVANAARLAALVGTRKVKGDPLEDRPHRLVRLERAPRVVSIVPASCLEDVARLAQRNEAGPGGSQAPPPTRLVALLTASGIAFRAQPPDSAGIVWYGIQHCPFHSDGRPYECGVGEAPDGRFAGKCFHPEGIGKGWREFKVALRLEGRPTDRGATGTESLRTTIKPAVTFNRTDAGNGEFFARLYGDQLRYDHRRERWLVWAEHWWRDDDTRQVRRLAKDAARARFTTATAIDDLEERTREAKFAIGTENRQRIDAMLVAAQSEPPIADAGDRWDADPWLLGVANGVVDLRTGALRPGSPDDRITQHVPVVFDPAAACPRWERFLDEVFVGDEHLITYITRAIGYSLTGDVSEQCLWMAWGGGANGKTVFLNVLRALGGSYAANTPFSTFEVRGRSAIPNDLAALAGKRIVTAAETAEGTYLNEERLKAFTGGETVTARFLNHEFFEYRPVAKLWLAVNHKPQVADDSFGFWRRVRLVPFTREFTVDADPGLFGKLHAELPGILAWAVRGIMAWQAQGLEPPPAVASATATYRAESDPLAEFLDARCIRRAGCEVAASAAFDAYGRWAAEQGLPDRDRLSVKTFGSRMTSRFEKRRSNAGIVYGGVGLLADRPREPGGAA
jgi:putative DNA primase/helicase